MGSNIGNRKDVIITALQKINLQGGAIVQTSALYETAPWGIAEQDLFLNAVVAIATPLPPAALLTTMLAIEKELGRTREVPKFGPRVLDIDILLYEDEVIDSPALKVPHPEMNNRRFTLQPLAEIAPKLIHPVAGKTIAQLLIECPDSLEVNKVGTIEF